jgi:hypothetical protein
MLPIKVTEKIKIHILCSLTFSENCAVYEIMSEKYVGATEATDFNMAACCTLD